MAGSRHVDKIVYCAVALAVVLTVLMMNAEALGITSNIRDPGYKKILFDGSKVHTIDLVVNNKEAFFADAEKHAYVSCSAVIDGDAANNVGLRVKGKTDLGNVREESRERMSFRLEFDHYQLGETWHGLDKLDLNNLIQDATCMKEYLTYSLMRGFGVPSPLASYAKVTLNGEEIGLYLAVEGVEDSFISRNYGGGRTVLYKPESTEGSEDARAIEAVKLKYTDDDPQSYAALLENAGTELEPGDRDRLIGLLKKLSGYEDLDRILDTEEILRYFVVHNFTFNDDSYTGSTVGNYVLAVRDGTLSMIPWDYNTAYGSASGMEEQAAVNAPIDAPAPEGRVDDRPMVGWIFSDASYKEQYHALFLEFIQKYAENGRIREMIRETKELIAP
ncbi:MAG: CotH kinase family protein, partial [Lachnospiraceae bacterium]|nr:CotH kinase family protein [Lachnospiraceae bacterium]